MKNFKQIAFGLLVGALAIRFSAFTNAKPKAQRGLLSTFRYYNNNGGVATSDASKYIYEGSDNCISDPSSECSVEWTTTNPPSDGQTPVQAGSPSKLPSTSESGDANF